MNVRHSIVRDRDTSTVTLGGELDMATSDDLTRLLVEEITSGRASHVQADLHAVDFIDSSGINALVKAYNVGQRHGCRFTVTGAHGHVRKVLDVTGVLSTLTAVPSAPR